MGTIADKLTRIITTKEDIRQALISKGYDVPTSIPFKEYAKMILDLPCNADSFPDIEGIVARYSALGLTNEQMAENPVWKDLMGNGYDLQMKNFAWSGMSGVGGYEMNFNLWTNNVPSVPDISMSTTTTSVSVSVGNSTYNNNLIYIHINNWDINKNHWLKVTSTYEDGDLAFVFYNNSNTKKIGLPANGYVNILAYPEFKGSYMYISTTSNKQGSFTIEQLPLYPGFILGDGVDDFAVTEKELNFEDTYTVYTAFIPFQNDPANNMVLCGKNHLKDFYITYSDLNRITFYSAEKLVFESLSKGFNILCCKRTPDKMVIKNLITDKSSEILANDLIDNPGLYYLWKGAVFANYAKAAIAGQTICNGYFSTDEDDEKVLNWYKKQYPWLFPDQAWTVTGKTNEDEDRATIANITGNGNDLILSNLGFAEGSGYGLYKTPFELYPSVQHSSKYSLSFSKFALGDHNLIIAPKQNDLSYDIKVKVTGLKDGVKFKWGWIGTTGYIDITTDGIHMLNKPASQIRQLLVEFAEDFDPDHVVTIEQIPEYEGYLITDGVDDEIISAKLIQFADKFTIVGDWKFMEDRNDNAGLLKANQIYIYNATTGMRIYLKQGSKNYLFSCKKINALTSDGWVYDEKWDKYKVYPIGSDIDITSRLFLGFYGSNFTKIALKNLGIYNNQLLSKDECIKAYNYLQTIKSK